MSLHDEPPNIQKPNRHDGIAGFMKSMKLLTASKLAVSGMDFIDKKEFEAAICDFREAQELYMELGAESNASNMLSMQGLCFYALGRYDEAVAVLREAIALKGCMGDADGKACDLLGLGEVYLKAGDGLQAEHVFGEALQIAEERHNEELVGKAMQGIDRARKLVACG
jgi:tetratricopeptide (TPR) repeat protein